MYKITALIDFDNTISVILIIKLNFKLIDNIRIANYVRTYLRDSGRRASEVIFGCSVNIENAINHIELVMVTSVYTEKVVSKNRSTWSVTNNNVVALHTNILYAVVF